MDVFNDYPSQPPTAFRWYLRGCGCLAVLAVLTFLAPAFWFANKDAGCADQMQRILYSLRMYAHDAPVDHFPTLTREPGRLMFDPAQLGEHYLTDPLLLVCPRDADHAHFELNPDEHYIQDPIDRAIAVDDWSYFYLGYTVRSEAEMERFAAAYRAYVLEGEPIVEDIRVYNERPEDARTFFRLRESVDRSILVAIGEPHGSQAAIQSQIPILIERIDNHPGKWPRTLFQSLGIAKSNRRGGHVLYLDGHVEYIEYPGKWPMTEKTLALLNELDALGPAKPAPNQD